VDRREWKRGVGIECGKIELFLGQGSRSRFDKHFVTIHNGSQQEVEKTLLCEENLLCRGQWD
jgi:hypothetical protein